MSDTEDTFRSEVLAAVKHALAVGRTSFEEVLKYVGATDPRIVRELYDKARGLPAPAPPDPVKATGARRVTASLFLKLPAADPIHSQWWFTLDTVAELSSRVASYSLGAPTAFLGVPTVGFHYSHSFGTPATILDSDSHLLEALELPSNAKKQQYDACTSLPPDQASLYTVVLTDPPWYPQTINMFLARSRQLIGKAGFILCVLPCHLTRPGILEERKKLFEELLAKKFEIESLEKDTVAYQVPAFEAAAYADVKDFKGRFWRRGDLLVLRVNPDSSPPVFEAKDTSPIMSFARSVQHVRFFLAPRRAQEHLESDVIPLPEFSETVSSRLPALTEIAVWGSNKRGAHVRDPVLAQKILEAWAQGLSPEGAAEQLKVSCPGATAGVVMEFDKALGIWSGDAPVSFRRLPPKLLEIRDNTLSELAVKRPSPRRYEFHPDDFRLDFQRDRDRVLWSNSLKRLALKTQLFPATTDEYLRHRLEHTIEVMQLASTISHTFGLDCDLTEAGAFAHDVGHAPFGHAGETAIHVTMNVVSPELGGFNHYEHGVDVVRWLEDVYQSPGAGSIPGLNLTFETEEIIFKHTFFRKKERYFAQQSLAESTKHEDLRADCSCHLEGQAVRIADKISYLISDLEDGIRMRALDLSALMSCRFFERPPIDMVPQPNESLYERFISQRGAILKVVMEDVITATDRRLATIPNHEAVRKHVDYLVDFSPWIGADLAEIWRELQSGRLHKVPEVIEANSRATRIVSDLFFWFCFQPELVESHFREAHLRLHGTEYMKWYIKRVGESVAILKRRVEKFAFASTIGVKLRDSEDNWYIPTQDLVLAKDYVASLADSRAIAEHQRIWSG